jgi:ribosomal subunit interface protein
MSISDEHREYLDKKVGRLRRMCPKIDELSFTLTKEKLHFEIEGNFRAGRIAAQAFVTASQPLEAIDALVDKLEAQISKTKAKMADKQSENPDKATARQSAMALVEEESPEN